MKKVITLIAMAALLVSCGNNGSKKGGKDKADQAAPAQTEVKSSGISIGDKFAFAGLQSDKLVPDFAIELSELTADPRSESKPMKDEAFFYTGADISK
ncbi:MAG: hypothetical protein II720_01295, partial [Bacteroidales bacterium]|nr:hypothetical protein [Bacteroidales bacterium]